MAQGCFWSVTHGELSHRRGHTAYGQGHQTQQMLLQERVKMGIMYKLVLCGERVSLLAGAIQCLLCQSITRISLTGKSNQMAETSLICHKILSKVQITFICSYKDLGEDMRTKPFI